MVNWSDVDVWELLAFNAEDQITRWFMRTLKDRHILDPLAKRLEEHDFNQGRKIVMFIK